MAAPVHAAQSELAHEAAFPPFDVHSFPSQILWLAITFGALYYVMSRVALPRLQGLLHERATMIARDLEEAHAARAESEAAGAAYEKSLADANAKAKAIAQETRDTLSAQTEARRKTLEAELAEKLAASEATIRGRTEEAMTHVRAIAADTAAAIVERLTGQVPDQATVEAALDRQQHA